LFLLAGGERNFGQHFQAKKSGVLIAIAYENLTIGVLLYWGLPDTTGGTTSCWLLFRCLSALV
jgi:hypothetical protein